MKSSLLTGNKGYLEPYEIAALLHAARDLLGNNKAYFMLALQYLLGLRIGEVVLLQYAHLGPLEKDARGVEWPRYVSVPTLKKREVGRNERDRDELTKLPIVAVPVLSHPGIVRAAFDRKYRPGHERHSPWLFPGRPTKKPMGIQHGISLFHATREEANLPDYYTPHVLRHSAAMRVERVCNKNRIVSEFLRHSRTRSYGGVNEGAPVTNVYLHTTIAEWKALRGCLDLPPLRPLRVGATQ